MSRILCKYFKNHGFCLKGEYCEFSHDIGDNIPICKYVANNENCPFGRSCAFRHQQNPMHSHKSVQQNFHPIENEITITTTAENQSRLVDLWQFASEDENQGVYFYGAPGAGPRLNKPAFSYLCVAKRGVEEKPDGKSNEGESLKNETSTRIVCAYFLVGKCRYGDRCQKFHPDVCLESDNALGDEGSLLVTEPNTSQTSSSKIDTNGGKSEFGSFEIQEMSDAIKSECGICMEKPEDGRLGLLNSCNCVFCLRCIREWRKNGKTISSSRQCPLCRKESHFVIPSTRLVRDPSRKEDFVCNYINSMNKIPCKYIEQGACPFGSSCFYSHQSKDGRLLEPEKPRFLLDSEAEVRVTSGVLLADYVAPRREGQVER